MNQVEIIKPEWHAPENIFACTTTRRAGFSRGEWSGLNLAGHVGDIPADVEQNRALLRQSVRLPSAPVWLNQVHGCEIAIADQLEEARAFDASMTVQPGIVCAVLTADCLPLLLCHEEGKRVAAVHAGWRGLAAGVIERAVAGMRCPAGELLAWLGPAIGAEVFAVGPEVREAFVSIEKKSIHAFKPQNNNKWLCDIYALARQRLARLGVKKISGGDRCVYRDATRFYSHRRDGVTGRMASLIWIR